MRFPSMDELTPPAEGLIRMPLPEFPETTFPSPGFGPPTFRLGGPVSPTPVSWTPIPFGSVAVPEMFTPIQFPLRTLPPHSKQDTPGEVTLNEFPEIRFRSPAVEPPTALLVSNFPKA